MTTLQTPILMTVIRVIEEDVRQEGGEGEGEDQTMMTEMTMAQEGADPDEGGVEEEVVVVLTVAGAALTSISLTPTLLVEAAAAVQARLQRTTPF